MKKLILSLGIGFTTLLTYSQQSFIGIQNSPRKGMIHAAMNPAELNNISRDVEINLFAVGATASNNVLSFDDLIKEDELLDLAFDRAEGPIDVRTEVHLIGPSFGLKVNKWSFGVISQVFAKGDIMELNTDLGKAFNDGNINGDTYEVEINNSANQRVNAAGWGELGLMAGREIWATDDHALSIGGTFKFLIPGDYVNIGLNNLQGTFIQTQDRSSLSDARGTLHISYPQELDDWDIDELAVERFSFNNISGFAVDLGISHQWKKEGIPQFNSGLSIKNLGGLNLGSDQVINAYVMDIPAGESFSLDQLDGDLEEIESQLLSSGYFTKSSQRGEARTSLPTMASVYTDIKISRIFQVSIFAQHRLSDQKSNSHLINQNVFAITPRLILGAFEIYSPWGNYEVTGLTGGAGLRLGGFFVGSHSVLTGLLANSKQVDVHLGLSLGFGKLNPKSNKIFE